MIIFINILNIKGAKLMTKKEKRQLKKELYTIMHKWSLNNSLSKILTHHILLGGDLDKRCISELAIVLQERMEDMKKNIIKTHLIMKL